LREFLVERQYIWGCARPQKVLTWCGKDLFIGDSRIFILYFLRFFLSIALFFFCHLSMLLSANSVIKKIIHTFFNCFLGSAWCTLGSAVRETNDLSHCQEQAHSWRHIQASVICSCGCSGLHKPLVGRAVKFSKLFKLLLSSLNVQNETYEPKQLRVFKGQIEKVCKI
jgi:hypothetical protein